MRNRRTKRFAGLLMAVVMIGTSYTTQGQCEPGLVSVLIAAHSYDEWAEETYWELVPAGNECGEGTVLSGSSEEVGCAGNGPTGENGIPDYGSEYLSVCLPVNELFDLHFVDWYGDGGLAFDVYLNGYLLSSYWGEGAGNVWTFETTNTPPALPYDSPCGAPELTPGGESLTFSNSECTAPFYEIHPPPYSCNAYGMWCDESSNRSAWSFFIAEEGVSYTISTCNAGTNFNTQVALWHGSDCAAPWEFELVSANDDAWGACTNGHEGSSVCYASCLIPGDIYYIMVDGFGDQSGQIELRVDQYTDTPFMETQVNDVVCPLSDGEEPSGSIFPSIQGTGSDFNCVWTGPDGYTSSEHFIYSLQPGTYQLTATTNCGEVFTGEYLIGLPLPWSVEIETTSPACPGSHDGMIEVYAEGATPEYTYSYDGPGNFSGSGQTLPNCIAGNYTVQVTDSRGCDFVTELNVPSSDNLEIDLGQDTTFCMGDQVLISGPAGLNYLWQDGSGNQYYMIDPEEWGLGSSALILTAYSDEGCIDTDVLYFTIESCIGVNEELTRALFVYPNPFSQLIKVQIPSDAIHKNAVLTDHLGRIVRTIPTRRMNEVWDFSTVSSGMYVLRIGAHALKLVKE